MTSPPLLIRNARVLSSSPWQRRSDAVLVEGGLIIALGPEADLRAAAKASRAEDLDLRGRTLAPAFLDAHLHLLAYAASLVSLDCRQGVVASIEDIKERIRARVQSLPPGAWVRATGYDEGSLAEGRHPTRRDLDLAAPDNPVRLTHRSGHACVLNSRALALAGIDASTPEPPGGLMERDLDSGEPTGLLLEMNDVVERVVPPLEKAELKAAVSEASTRLLASGMTFIQDATHTNGAAEWALFEELIEDGALRQTVSLMEGADYVGELPERSERLRRGPVKVMPRELEHEFYPSAAELATILRRIEAAGREAAVHAVTHRGLDVVLDAFQTLGRRANGHRIEHCGVCSPAQAARIARLGLTVVTQPGFLYSNGDLMLRRLPAGDLSDLYPLRGLLDAGVLVAGSSDAPVVDPDVIAALRAALERRSHSGQDMGAAQAVSPTEALAMFTSSAALALGVEHERGAIAPGLAGDFVVLNQHLSEDSAAWEGMTVEMTIQAGEVVYEAARPSGLASQSQRG